MAIFKVGDRVRPKKKREEELLRFGISGEMTITRITVTSTLLVAISLEGHGPSLFCTDYFELVPPLTINKGDYIDAREFTYEECKAFIDLAVECGHGYGEGMEYFGDESVTRLGVISKIGFGLINWGRIRDRGCGFDFGNNITAQFRDYLNKGKTMFTKDDLRDGMRVTYRNDSERIVLDGRLIEKIRDAYGLGSALKAFNDDLTHNELKAMDIMTVKDRDGAVLFQRAAETVKVTLELTPEQADSIKKQFGIE